MTETPQVHHATVFDDTTRRVARVYAEALLNAAERQHQSAEVLEELEALIRDVFNRQRDFEVFLASAVIGRERKEEVLRRAFEGKVSPLLFNFLLVLNDRARLDVLRGVAVVCREIFERRAGRMHVGVASALPLDDEQKDRLRRELREKFGREPVLSVKVDPDLLGGLVVRVDDWVYDASVRTRLEQICNHLIERSSHEIQRRRDRFSH
jgi:F-type H+-transporting ATPase subunit delta